MEKTTLGQALVERRAVLGVDKSAAAARIGIARSTYAAYELDSRRLSVDILSALGKFLDVAIDDLLDLYGATCIAQARIALLRDMFIGDTPVQTNAELPSTRIKEMRDSDMSVLKRVYFDVVTTTGHDVTAPYVAPPSDISGFTRTTTSRVLDQHEDRASLPEETRKSKRKKKSSHKNKKKTKSKPKKKTKDKGKRKKRTKDKARS